jgi:serine/threonine protein kinase
MVYDVPIAQAQTDYPEFQFVAKLTPSAQKAAFHVRDRCGTDLCLKIISPDYELDRLNREILAMQAINHPNVACFVKYEKSMGGTCRHFILEEYVEGEDLLTFFETGDIWDVDRAAHFFSSLFDGLEAVHEANLVHRDIKPSNIRVRPDGSPVIIDLGYALHQELPSITTTRAGAAVGTWDYFAPEQFMGNRADVDHRTDIFASGILLFQAVTGIHPFYSQGMSRQDTENSVCTSDQCFSIQEFINLPDTWKSLIRRLLSKDRSNRPHSAQQAGVILRGMETS